MSSAHTAFVTAMQLYEQSKPAESLPWFRTAAEQYQEENNPEGICRSLTVAGEACRILNDIELATQLLAQAASIAESQLGVHYPFTKANAFLAYGNCLTNLGRADEAKTFLTLAIEQANLTGDDEVNSNANLFLGQHYLRAGEFDAARKPVELAAYYAKRVQKILTKCNAFLTYGEMLISLQESHRALPWLEQAARLSLEQPDLRLRCNCCWSFGSHAHDLQWLQQAAEIGRTLEDAHTACNAFISYAELLAESEAVVWLRRAAVRLGEVHDPHTRLNVQSALIEVYFRRGQWAQVLAKSLEAAQDLLHSMEHNPYVRGVSETRRSPIISLGVFAADQLQRAHPELHAMVNAMHLIETVKSVAIREGLCRHIEGSPIDNKPPSWAAGPEDWTRAFASNWVVKTGTPAPAPTEWKPTMTLRGPGRKQRFTPDHDHRSPLELPGSPRKMKNRFCETLNAAGLDLAIPDDQTLILYFHMLGTDVVIMPLHRQGNVVVLEGGAEGLVWLRGCTDALDQLVDEQRAEIEAILELETPDQVRERATLGTIYRNAFNTLQGGDLLALLNRRLGSLEEWNVVVVPDGPLLELPMHALVVDENSRRLYECFRSFRYGFSLKTLAMQSSIQTAQRIRHEGAPSPRLCIFANPDSEARIKPLPSVVQEVAAIVDCVSGFPGSQFRVHGDAQGEFRASRESFEKWHGSGNLLWTCGHGGELEDTMEGHSAKDISLLLCDGQPVGPARFLHDAYDFTAVELFVASACMLGRGLGSRENILSFNATLALRGCRRVTSALWDLFDDAGPAFAAQYMQAILDNAFASEPGNHGFAQAYTTAIKKFREHDRGLFDHEFFWAPYTFYGLG